MPGASGEPHWKSFELRANIGKRPLEDQADHLMPVRIEQVQAFPERVAPAVAPVPARR